MTIDNIYLELPKRLERIINKIDEKHIHIRTQYGGLPLLLLYQHSQEEIESLSEQAWKRFGEAHIYQELVCIKDTRLLFQINLVDKIQEIYYEQKQCMNKYVFAEFNKLTEFKENEEGFVRNLYGLEFQRLKEYHITSIFKKLRIESELVKYGKQLLKLTKKHCREEFYCRERFRGKIGIILPRILTN